MMKIAAVLIIIVVVKNLLIKYNNSNFNTKLVINLKIKLTNQLINF